MTEPTNPRQALERLDPMPMQHSDGLAVTGSLVNVVALAIKDKDIDVEKMERLFALQERLLAKQSEAEFTIAMKSVQSEMPYVKRDARNSSTNSSYVRLDTLIKAVVPVYTRHGFTLSFGTADCPIADHYRVTCECRHAGGHVTRYQADVPRDDLGPKGMPSKTKTHGFGSALTYGRRYLTLLIFNVNTGDDDDGNAAGGIKDGGETITKLKADLWAIVKPIRGTENNWKMARQWLVDEMCLDPSLPIADLDAAGLKATIAAAKKKLEPQ